MVIREKLKNIIAMLRENGCENAVFEANQLMRSVMNLSATDLVIRHTSVLPTDKEQEIDALVKRRICGEPLQYIIGTQEFMSLEFIVNRSVLIPRADTETLVEFLLEQMNGKGFTLLDIGTGTGCIPLSVAHYNRRAYVRGIDISEKALETAEKNCARLNLCERASFEQLDILSEIPHGKYDVITSNPPYIEHDVIDTLQTEVKDNEPHLALDGGNDGLKFYRRICEAAPGLLGKDGRLIFEIGCNQAESVCGMLEKDFRDIGVIKDLCGNDRVVSAVKKSG